MKRRSSYNPKRRIAEPPVTPEAFAALEALAAAASYGGNPEHKRNPGDFGLDPPASPRLDKTLCDEVGVFRRAEALALLREGLRRGMVSVQQRNGWPQNVWAVTEKGEPLEAQLENQETGKYHGYPMQKRDLLRPAVLQRWRQG